MLKVLFVMGHGGTGSTLLGNLLGELDGFFHPGELRTFWRVGLRGLRQCGCGRPVSECPFWSSVMRLGFGDAFRETEDIERVRASLVEMTRFRNVPRILRLERGKPAGWTALDGYIPIMERLYQAAAEAAGARVLVDSSKRPLDAAILRLATGMEPYVLELVRDPRAVAYSWRRDRGEPALRTARRCVTVALGSAMVRRRYGRGRSMVLRYEDVVARPREALEGLTAWLGESSVPIPVGNDRNVRLSPNHTISGHVTRMNAGTIELRENPEWRPRQSVADRLAVTISSFPLLLRYRYPLIVRRTLGPT